MRVKAIIMSLFLFSFVSGYVWWNEPDTCNSEYEEGSSSFFSGDQKALILVTKFPDDTPTYLPAYCDSLIAPSMDSISSGRYQYSITNYLYTVSNKSMRVTGMVNPGMNGRYVTAPHSLSGSI